MCVFTYIFNLTQRREEVRDLQSEFEELLGKVNPGAKRRPPAKSKDDEDSPRKDSAKARSSAKNSPSRSSAKGTPKKEEKQDTPKKDSRPSSGKSRGQGGSGGS